MGLRDEFELARSHILHQDPLPTVSQAIHKLVDNETRLQTEPISIQTMVLATPTVVPIATPEPGPTRLASLNRNPEDAHLFLFIYILLRFLFQKCRDPNLRHEPNGEFEPEPGLL